MTNGIEGTVTGKWDTGYDVKTSIGNLRVSTHRMSGDPSVGDRVRLKQVGTVWYSPPHHKYIDNFRWCGRAI